jgi:hypothetical protein
MKKKVTTVALAALMIVAVSTISSCKKKDSTTTTTPAATTDTNTSSAQDHQTAENNSNDADQMGSEGMDNGNINSNYRIGGGTLLSPMSGSVTVTPNLTAKTVMITFSSYVGLDGHLRSGTIMYDYSASLIATATNFRDSGIVINVSTPNNDYYVDSNKIQINKTITNMGRSLTTHNLTWHVTTTLAITKADKEGTIQFTSDRFNTLLNTNVFSFNSTVILASFTGFATPINWSTAVMGITSGPNGTTGVSADGVGFSANISTMLVRNFNCGPSLTHIHFHPFVAGQIDFTPTGKTTRSINFGTGTCDETYTITIGSWSASFTYNL